MSDGKHGESIPTSGPYGYASADRATDWAGYRLHARCAARHSSLGLLNATFQYPTGGAEAIDIARKILEGEKVPKKVTLKSRVFTKENVKQGGEVLQ